MSNECSNFYLCTPTLVKGQRNPRGATFLKQLRLFLYTSSSREPLLLWVCLNQINGVHCCSSHNYREFKKKRNSFSHGSHVMRLLFAFLTHLYYVFGFRHYFERSHRLTKKYICQINRESALWLSPIDSQISLDLNDGDSQTQIKLPKLDSANQREIKILLQHFLYLFLKYLCFQFTSSLKKH